MPDTPNFTLKTINRLRAAQDELVALHAHVLDTAAAWLKTDLETLHVQMPIRFEGKGSAATLTVEQKIEQDDVVELVTHKMPVTHLYATADELDADYRKFQELQARFAGAGA